ncbi:hypothetical protein [Cedecea sp.]|uniref:hypothetical protein n=1 Tax=Cedecea sp. TaxID=1970739 RepID=UPI002F42CA7E
MKSSAALIFLTVLFSFSSCAADVKSCSDLSGQWETTTDSPHVTMSISPSSESCGTGCVELNVQYGENHNRLYCHDGIEGKEGMGPMVIAFEGAYGGHSIGTYNRQLKRLWSGVIPKNSDGKWEMKMDDYWFKKVGN